MDKKHQTRPQKEVSSNKKGDKKKQYFEKHIRHQNKEFLSIQQGGHTYIPYDVKNKGKFIEACKTFANTQDELISFRKAKPTAPEPEVADVTDVGRSKSKTIQKVTFTERSNSQAVNQQAPIKPLPRYMQITQG